MGGQSWNKADKTLLLAAVLFAFALCLRLEFPASLVTQGFLFCAEAALVGGIADWFAVTALFRKPLGFPYHTAILPRRREAFIDATAGMVQREFFAKRKLFHLVREIGWRDMLVKWLSGAAEQQVLAGQLVHYTRRFLLRLDGQQQIPVLSGWIRQRLAGLSAGQLIDWLLSWLQQEQHAQQLLARGAGYLRPRLRDPACRKQIITFLQNYQQQQLAGKSSLFAGLAGLAQTMNLVNFDEVADLLQQQAEQVLDELAETDSAFQQQLLTVFYERVALLSKDEVFLTAFEQLRQILLRDLPVEEALQAELEKLRGILRHGNLALPAADPSGIDLQSVIADFFQKEIARWLSLLQTNDAVKQPVDQLLYDMAARSMLQAQAMAGVVVRQVLARMTDEQMNRLVYDKVEPDLLWIRMNGSIVGAGIGFFLFVLLTVLHKF